MKEEMEEDKEEGDCESFCSQTLILHAWSRPTSAMCCSEE